MKERILKTENINHTEKITEKEKKEKQKGKKLKSLKISGYVPFKIHAGKLIP
ncbi:MAG: hypothetical protein K0R29_2671 [Pseudobdellovibrio sp.]|jgi:hypothetical protein|nr:hypothetical protein [Pseudobdellovibrio sp.]